VRVRDDIDKNKKGKLMITTYLTKKTIKLTG
jgi:hypothetical protein